MVSRGDIWLVNLDPGVGNEMCRARICIVVSPAEIHDHLGTVLVASMKTGGCPAPFRPGLSYRGKQGLILLDQLRSVDKSRMVQRLGAVSAKTLKKTLRTLQDFFADS